MSMNSEAGSLGGMERPFCEEVAALTGLFESWPACERTVVAYALLRRVPWPGLRLLSRAIDAVLAREAEAQREAEANEPRWLSAAGGAGERLARLVAHVPLLRPGNEAAKRVYLRAVPLAVQAAVAQPALHLDRAQQLLSYLLIHPALSDADRRSLTQWLLYLENHIFGISKTLKNIWPQPTESPSTKQGWPNNGNQTFRRTIGKNVEFKSTLDEVLSEVKTAPSQTTEENLQESFSKNGTEIEVNDADKPTFDPAIIQPKARRSNSLTPPSTSYGLISSSSENLNVEHFMQKPRSFSLSSEHSLLNVQPISNLSSSSGSETKLDDLRYSNVDHDGMSTIAQWLKTLRLHKYIWLFSNISYDQMLAIDEEYLQRLGVTKGARHKLLLSIKKLSERETMLEEMERELSNGSYISVTSMTSILEQLRNIVISPIKPESDLASLLVRVLDISSARLLSSGSSYQDGGSALALHCWIVDRALAHDAFSRSAALALELKSLKYRVPPRQFLAHLNDAPFQRRPKPRWRNWQSNDSNRKSSSYPSFPSQPPLPRRLPPASSMGDINSRLESLCLQMTEQAIN